MIYVLSDIHGCYQAYSRLLQMIQFSDNDELYILGDVMDRGDEPFEVLFDMMGRKNICPILGNHDYVALSVMQKIIEPTICESFTDSLNSEELYNYQYWIWNGGMATLNRFLNLSSERRQQVVDYLKTFIYYKELTVNGKNYFLVHADYTPFDPTKPLDKDTINTFLFLRTDYKKQYFDSTYLVTGHTPTMLLRDDSLPLVYEGNGHIAIDCGCVFGGQLAAYCLNTNEVFYTSK
ncbi:MAG: metallophosphoesterase [Acutalibacteraceae bacterium]